jgi:hypothetical protein
MKYEYVPKYYRLYNVSTKLTNARLIMLDAMLIDVIDNKMLPTDVANKYGIEPRYFRGVLSIQRKRGLVVDLTEAYARDKTFSSAELLTSSTDSPPKMSQAVIDKIRKLYATGLTQRNVAQMVGVSQSTVMKYTKVKGDNYRSERADPTEPYGGPHA